MPLYEYHCDACGRRFEVIRRFSDPALDTCTLCGKGPVSRLPSSPAIQFKGSGFYITDYGPKGETGKSDKASTEKAQDAKSDAAAAGRGSEKGAGATAEGKTETAVKSDAPAKSETAPTPSSSAPTPSSSAPTPSSGSKD